ncbi:alanyl-tRNA editing protein [Candidatus Woesearchaeota archaeon]|nr:alanyl-tRNA editing protein [Candidatus Woesearchaeota archaeon]MBW3021929.1 alanyl-tRNA editing protein [Candidatus Woesearchaeota archaeon]
MHGPLYFDDCYLKEFDATVKSVKDGKFVVLDNTAFYPNMGGQPNDTGVMIKGGEEFKVVFVGKFDGEISHEVDHEGLVVGDSVHCVIDWERRYTLMKYHTAAHILSKVIYNETGAVTSGNQLGLDRSRIDFTLQEFDKDKVQGWIDKANEIIAKGAPVKIHFLTREEAMKIPDFIRTYKDLLPKGVEILRVINIEDFDQQACGGTHLKNISEIGKIELVKIENKGKGNRRVYFRLV